MVDLVGIEPTTSSMPWKRAPSCATGPRLETAREIGIEGSTQFIFAHIAGIVNARRSASSDSVKRHLPIEYAADLTPVVAGKEAGASWNARGMENALDF